MRETARENFYGLFYFVYLGYSIENFSIGKCSHGHHYYEIWDRLCSKQKEFVTKKLLMHFDSTFVI